MAASIRASEKGLQIIDQARRNRGWTKTEPAWFGGALTSEATLKRFWARKFIRQDLFIAICQEVGIGDWEKIAGSPSALNHSDTGDEELRRDWGEAPKIFGFFGRTKELEILKQWIIDDRCQLVGILGTGGIGKTGLSIKLGKGGIGKTKLSAKLARGIEDEFEYVIWRRLLNAPPLTELLTDLIKFLSDQQEINLPETLDAQISRLLYYLRSHRCLIVLDNAESVLQGGNRAGQYREGYEGYGQLLRQVGEVPHQSCLLLTSREKPQEVARLEGNTRLVRSLKLDGLNYMDGRKIFEEIGSFHASDDEWKKLIEFYNGNPLALELVAKHINEVFFGDVSEFLRDGQPVFDDLRELLGWHFNRLSRREKEMMYWLTINRESVSLSEIKEDVLSLEDKERVPSTLQSLQRRLTLEKTDIGFTLQPVLIEYMTECLIEIICEEIEAKNLKLFNSHALIKAITKDYVREIQIRTILEPIINRSLTTFKDKDKLESQLIQILSTVQEEASQKLGYTGGNIINLLGQLKEELRDYDFSHIAVWQAYLTGVKLHNINFTSSNLSRSVFTQTFGTTLSVAFSQDGKLLATGDTEGEIRLWRLVDDQLILILKRHDDWVWSIDFSPDDQILATGGGDKSVKLWDINTGRCIKTLKENDQEQVSEEVSLVVFNTDGKRLFITSRDGILRQWDINSNQCLRFLKGCNEDSSNISSVAISPNQQYFATDSKGGEITIWDLQTGRNLRTLQGHTNWVCSITFSPDSRTLASGSEDHSVRLWNLETGECLGILKGHSGAVKSVAFSFDGTVLASCSHDQTLRLWNVGTGKCIKTLQGHKNRVISLAFGCFGEATLTRSNQILASSADDQTVKLWDLSTGQCIRTLQGYTNWIGAATFNPSNQSLAAGCQDGTIAVWDINANECLKSLKGHTNLVHSVVFSLDGQTIASGSEDDTIRLWDAASGQCIQVLGGHITAVRSVAFSPDGQVLASCHWDRMVRLWDIVTGQCLSVLKGHTDWMRSVAFSPDGETVISSSNDQTAKIWDLTTVQCYKTFRLGSVGQSATFSPDGQTIATANEDRTVRLWDTNTGTCVGILHGHDLPLRMVAFSPDGQILASCSYDQTIKLWDMNTSKCIKTLRGHTSPVNSVSFSSNNQFLASGSGDGTVRCWDFRTGECLKTLRPLRPYEGTDITGVIGLTEAQKTTLKLLGAVERT